MPGELPASSGYTYAVELTVDEAMANGGGDVRFSPPPIHYVENFLGFPVGSIVPVGSYDRPKRRMGALLATVACIQILSISNGLAELDLNGSGVPADASALAELDVTEAERQQLADLYGPGQSLWRVPISHFSPWDCNLASWGAGTMPIARRALPRTAMIGKMTRAPDSAHLSSSKTRR